MLQEETGAGTRYELTDKGRQYLALAGQLRAVEDALDDHRATDDNLADLRAYRDTLEAEIDRLLSEP